MARMTDEEQKEQYAKAKPFSREGRLRAAGVAMGSLKGLPSSTRKKHKTKREEEEDAKQAAHKTEHKEAHAAHDAGQSATVKKKARTPQRTPDYRVPKGKTTNTGGPKLPPKKGEPAKGKPKLPLKK